MFAAIGKNKRKSAAIVFAVFVLLAVVTYFIAEYTGFGEFAVVIAIAVSFISVFFSYYYSDKLVLKISGARKANPEQDKQVRNAMEGLVISAGLPMPEIYIIDDPSPNAFATGRNPKNSVVCVTTGLLRTLDYYQLEAVLAHELAHIKNYDILLSTVVAVMIGAVIMISDIWARSLIWGGGRSKRRDDNQSSGGVQMILLIVGVVFMILAPIAGQLMQLALSRNREYLADATAVEFTRNPEGLATALLALEGSAEPIKRVSDATAGMYIVCPFKGNKRKKGAWLSTHPPIEKRVEAIRNIR